VTAPEAYAAFLIEAILEAVSNHSIQFLLYVAGHAITLVADLDERLAVGYRVLA
jgi:hypothetical protein